VAFFFKIKIKKLKIKKIKNLKKLKKKPQTDMWHVD